MDPLENYCTLLMRFCLDLSNSLSLQLCFIQQALRQQPLIFLDSCYTFFKQLQNELIQKRFSLSALGGLQCYLSVLSCYLAKGGKWCLGISGICCRINKKKVSTHFPWQNFLSELFSNSLIFFSAKALCVYIAS